jgi:hypothetical protein
MPGIKTAINVAIENEDVNPADILKNDIFISYSRRDIEFVQTLDRAFRSLGRDPWIDWDDIKKGENWWSAIEAGIEAADTFVFVISPDSVASPVCRNEVEYAAKLNKRIMPIVWREGFEMSAVHPAIASQNWLFFRGSGNFDHALRDLIIAIETDLEHVRAHTRLLVRALEWESKGNDDSFLLRGKDLSEAEQWLIKALEQKPKPTKLQAEYINASRITESERMKAQIRARQIIAITSILANAVIALTGYGVVQFASHKAIQLISKHMVNTVNGAIAGINGDDFEQLANIELPSEAAVPSDSLIYQKHQEWLNTIHRLEPRAYAYTFIHGQKPYEVLWIGDAYRDIHPETATHFKDSYIADPSQTKLHNGLSELTVTTDPYTNQWGTWISVYAPIQDSDGNLVGGMGVDFNADYALNIESTIRQTLILAYAITFICLLVLGIIILRVTYSLTLSSRSDRHQLATARK